VTDLADLALMRRAIAVAERHLGETWPNPVVGCVLAREGRVLDEAATAPGGRPHAEQQVLLAAADSARGADAYVTLEPCALRSDGSASCSERLVAAGVRRVLVASGNPHGLSAGAGLERLRAAGITVITGVLLAEADAVLYRGFHRRLSTGLPLLEAADGPAGFDALFEPWLEETLEEALRRYGQAGYNRLWAPADGELVEAAAAQGLLG
jgi:diaminohydroxyphosphoribosylaminopyrimidine deaminase/5-amino-6-(5-phosphoribosylamino)uracil reductase